MREEREELTIRCNCLHESTRVAAGERTRHRRVLCSLHCSEQRHSITNLVRNTDWVSCRLHTHNARTRDSALGIETLKVSGDCLVPQHEKL